MNTPAIARWMPKRTLTVLISAVRNAREQRIAQVASSLAFTTALALVPLFTLTFDVVAAFPIFRHIQGNLREWPFRDLVPASISGTVLHYVSQFSAKAHQLRLVGSAFLIVTSFSAFVTVERALNVIWQAPHPRPLYRRLLIYSAALTLGPVVFAGSLALSAFLIGAPTLYSGPAPWAAKIASGMMSTLLMTLAYAALYVFVPHSRVAWRNALVGGFCAAIAFEVSKRGFALYVLNFRTLNVIYGALAALPMFLIWIYLSWLITLFGANVAACVQAQRDQVGGEDSSGTG